MYGVDSSIDKTRIGRTDIQISRLGLGTVALGMDYGIKSQDRFGRPAVGAAIKTIRAALNQGVTFFDTAPSYGRSEELLGLSLAGETNCTVATKVSVERGLSYYAQKDIIQRSIEYSLEKLARPKVDILKIHNATVESLSDPNIEKALIFQKYEGRVTALGASVYTEQEALAAIHSGWIEVVQIPFSILDQRPMARILRAAQRAGVGLVIRSILLKGALTDRARFLPPSLAELKQAALAARELLLGPTDDVNNPAAWAGLPAAALRFGLSHPAVSCVLIGAQTEEELNQAVTAAAQGPLPRDIMARTPELALTDPKLVNPALWEID